MRNRTPSTWEKIELKIIITYNNAIRLFIIVVVKILRRKDKWNLKVELNIKVNGLEDKNMGKVLRFGLMGPSIRVCGFRERQLERVYLLIFMGIHIMVIGRTIKLMVMEYTYMLRLVQSIRVIGRMICSMGQV